MASTVQKLMIALGVDDSKFKKGMDSAAATIKKLAGALGVVYGTREILRFTAETVKLAAKAEGVKAAFDRLNDPTLLGNLRRATKNTVSDLELMSNAVQANNLGIPVQQLGTLFKFASMRARETGESVDYLVSSLVFGLGRKSTLRLDNLGLSLETLNNEIAKTGDFFTGSMAVINREIAKSGTVADTSADQIDQLSTSWKNFREELGKKINNAGLGDALALFAEWMRMSGDDTLTRGEKRAIRRYGKAGGAGMYDSIIGLIEQQKLYQTGGYDYSGVSSQMWKQASGQFQYIFPQATGQPSFNVVPNFQKQIVTVQILQEEVDLLTQRLSTLDITNTEEIASTRAQIKAKEDLIESIMGATKAAKENYDFMKLSSADFMINLLKNNDPWGNYFDEISQKDKDFIATLEEDWVEIDLSELDKQLEAITDGVLASEDSFKQMSSTVTSLFGNMFSAGIQGWDEFGKAAVDAIKNMLVQLAALAATYALLSLIPGFSAFMETVGGFKGFMRQGMGFGSAPTNIANVTALGSTQRLEIVGKSSGYDMMWTTARAGNRFNSHT